MKKLLLTSMLTLAMSPILAVTLRNGTEVPLQKVNKVYDALKKLEQENRSVCSASVGTLYVACHEYDRKITQVAYWDKTGLAKVQELGLCNAQGIIDQDTADIIMSAIRVKIYIGFYNGMAPFKLYLQSPIAWSNYGRLSYWFKKA